LAHRRRTGAGSLRTPGERARRSTALESCDDRRIGRASRRNRRRGRAAPGCGDRIASRPANGEPMTATPRPSFAAGRLEELASGPLSALSSMLELEEFADGAEVLREGDSGDWLGVVLEGEGVVEKRI